MYAQRREILLGRMCNKGLLHLLGNVQNISYY